MRGLRAVIKRNQTDFITYFHLVNNEDKGTTLPCGLLSTFTQKFNAYGIFSLPWPLIGVDHVSEFCPNYVKCLRSCEY